MELKKNTIIETRIYNLTYGGRGIGKYNGMVIFIPGTVPGDLVSARVVRKKASYAEAELVDVSEPSNLRIKPRCPLFGTCGGCSWQNVPYEDQLVFKEEITRSTLEHMARQSDFNLHPIIASPRKWRYRNKVDYTFGKDAGGKTVLGFHKTGNYYEILDVEKCYIQPEIFDDLIEEMRTFAREKELTPYNPKTHEGFLRHFVLRCTGNPRPGTPPDVIAVLLTAGGELMDCEELASRLKSRCPSLCGFIHGENRGKGDVARMDRLLFLSGQDYITDYLDDLSIRVSAFSFFQTNTPAARLLYSKTREFLGMKGEETLLDAYCGAGSIALFCSRDAGRAYGIEILRKAIWDARLNAEMNNISNCVFLSGDLRKTLPLLRKRVSLGFQRIVVDPPRGGMDKKSLKGIISLKAPVLVYVSCNPTTFARDSQALSDARYRITDVQPVDMFPQTYHIETVTRFEMS